MLQGPAATAKKLPTPGKIEELKMSCSVAEFLEQVGLVNEAMFNLVKDKPKLLLNGDSRDAVCI